MLRPTVATGSGDCSSNWAAPNGSVSRSYTLLKSRKYMSEHVHFKRISQYPSFLPLIPKFNSLAVSGLTIPKTSPLEHHLFRTSEFF